MGNMTINLKKLQVNKFGRPEVKNEVYVVSLAMDLSGAGQTIEPEGGAAELLSYSFKQFNKYAVVAVSPLFSNVHRGDKLSMLGDGLLLYGPADPKGKIALHTVVMESDADHRRIGSKMEKALKRANVFEALEAIGDVAAIAAPQVGVVARPVTSALRYAFESFVFFMKEDGDDVISTFHYSSWDKPDRGYVCCEDGKPFKIKDHHIKARLMVHWDE